jgi:hypothetical protein
MGTKKESGRDTRKPTAYPDKNALKNTSENPTLTAVMVNDIPRVIKIVIPMPITIVLLISGFFPLFPSIVSPFLRFA